MQTTLHVEKEEKRQGNANYIYMQTNIVENENKTKRRINFIHILNHKRYVMFI